MSESATASFEPIIIRFPHAKDDLRRIPIKDGENEFALYRISPVILHWPAEQIPDTVNPRSHKEECLKTKVARDIEKTLRDEPEDFWLANRGGFLLADRVKFDPDRGQVEITLTDEDLHGLADGATTNAVMAKLRNEWQRSKEETLRAALATARFNLDVVVGLTDHNRIAKLIQGRNRSIPVKEWSLNDFKGEFDWLKALIDRKGGPFRDKIGWEENASADVSVLDLISLMTLFHPDYDGRAGRRLAAPTVAYSSKGTADRRLTNRDMASGFRTLTPVLEDILRLHDHVYAGFEPAYERYNKEVYNKGAKAGKRRGIERRNTHLPLTGMVSEYRVDKGLIFPLLAAHRALLRFDSGTTAWRTDPHKFFDEYGSDLVGLLIEEYEKLGKNPASTGKNRSVYVNLHTQAKLFLTEAVH